MSVSNTLFAGAWQASLFTLLWELMVVPLVWPSQATHFRWTNPPNHSWVCMQFRECTCHLLRVLSVTLRGLHWPYVRLCMRNSCRSKTNLNKNHIQGWGNQVKLMSWFYNEFWWFELLMVEQVTWFQQRSHEVYRLCLNPEYERYRSISCSSVWLKSGVGVYKGIL